MLAEHQILSKVLEENNFHELNKFNINQADFNVIPDVYKFIKDYVGDNHSVPDFRTVAANFESFNYLPETSDSFKFLSKQLKDGTAKKAAYELLSKEAGDKFSDMAGGDYLDWMAKRIESIKEATGAESFTGINYATSGADRWKSYQENKSSEESKLYIPSPYPTLNRFLGGGFELGDYVLLQAYTNRGKSWIASQLAVWGWNNDNAVLHYSPELSEAQQQQRNDTLAGHFNNQGLKQGELNSAEEQKYSDFLQLFNSKEQDTPYIIKTMEHLPNGLDVNVIEADLLAHPEIKMVILDGFNLMRHGNRGSNRDSMSNTSRLLRQLFARHQVVGIVVHQTPSSTQQGGNEDEDGARIVKPAKIHEYSETIAVIQDACTVINFDQFDGLGKLLLAKARTPHVDEEITLHCDFNHGYITEAAAVDFF